MAETLEVLGKEHTLKKHIGTVQIANPMTLLQRKAFSVLLFKSYHEIKNAEGKMHEIPLSVFCDLLGYNSKDFKTLDKQIEKLQFTKIEWMDNPDEFSRVSFFSYTGVKNGMFQFSFHPELEKKLYHPEIFAKINILALRQFQSKYAVALYENLSRYAPNRGFKGGSPKWSIEEFRIIMGVGDSYPQFKFLKTRVINPALKEINDLSDFIVVFEPIKSGRKITHVKFHISQNPQTTLGLIPEPQTVEQEANTPEARELSQISGVPEMQAGSWLLSYGKERFSEVLGMFKKALDEGKVKSPVGWLKRCFENDWKPEIDPQEVKKKLTLEKLKKKQEKQQKLDLENREKEQEAQRKKEEAKGKIDLFLEGKESQEREVKYFIPFHQEHEEIFSGLSDFLTLGSDPRKCENDMVKDWFFDFMSEKMGL